MLPTKSGIYRMTCSNGNVFIVHCSDSYYSEGSMAYWTIEPVTFAGHCILGSANARDFSRKYSPVRFDELFLHDENGLCGSLHEPLENLTPANEALAS